MNSPEPVGPFLESENFVIRLMNSMLQNNAILVLEDMRAEGRELAAKLVSSEPDKKETLQNELKLHMEDRKHLFKTLLTDPVERDC